MKDNIYILKPSSGRVPPLLGTPAFTEATEHDLRLLLALLELDEADACRLATLLDIEESAASASLAFWRGAGVITLKKEEQTPAPEVRTGEELGAEELASAIKEGGLAYLIAAAERQRACPLGRTDLAALVRLSTDLNLDGSYILTLLAYCDNRGEGDRKPLRYAERVALRLAEHGITTCEALEAYIREQEELHSVEGELRRMFGIGTRRLTAREEKAFLTWSTTYGYTTDLIGAAFDVTVNALGKASVAYTDKILAHWYEAGVKSVPEAAALCERERAEKEAPRKKAAPKKKEPAGSFDVGDFFQRALDRSFKSDHNTDHNS